MDIADKLILQVIESGVEHATGAAAERLGVSRQSVAARLKRLANEGVIKATGIGRGRRYTLQSILTTSATLSLEGLEEFRVWQEKVAPVLTDLPKNVLDCWRYGVTEMVNNAIDHSEGKSVEIRIQRTALRTSIRIRDDGEGIFHRIQRLLGLYDAREAILELAKGKLTTDPQRHTGEGIFFTSRIFDRFSILSRNLFFSHVAADDWLIDGDEDTPGTVVTLELENESSRTVQEVFDQFAAPDEYSFAKTVVPVRLAQHEGEKLVSRSQAKRLAMRFDKFKTVVLDFAGVEEIGQAFSDEVFRVFKTAHPDLEMIPINMSDAVRAMVNRAEGHR